MAGSGMGVDDRRSAKRVLKLATPWISGIVNAISKGFSVRVRSTRRMELVETLQLGGKRQLMLVVCDGREYLVGAGADGVASIAELHARVDPLTNRGISLSEKGFQSHHESESRLAIRDVGFSH